jgi:hypothetical protein
VGLGYRLDARCVCIVQPCPYRSMRDFLLMVEVAREIALLHRSRQTGVKDGTNAVVRLLAPTGKERGTHCVGWPLCTCAVGCDRALCPVRKRRRCGQRTP